MWLTALTLCLCACLTVFSCLHDLVSYSDFMQNNFLMSFELLTFPGRYIIQLVAHAYTTCFQNESIYIHKMHILYGASFLSTTI